MRDWGALLERGLPTFDASPLAWAKAALHPKPGELMPPALISLPKPECEEGMAALSRLFRLDLDGHCFTTKPHSWATFHEPQITGGFVHFLEQGGLCQQLSRALAFYRAACRCIGREPAELAPHDVADFEIVAEEPTARKGHARGCKRAVRGRIDILVHFALEDGTCLGAALEAKFDHGLGRGQLKKYDIHLKDVRGWDERLSARLLVGKRPNVDQAIWHSTTWWCFLMQFEHEIAGQDDDDFRRFRRTIWDTAHG